MNMKNTSWMKAESPVLSILRGPYMMNSDTIRRKSHIHPSSRSCSVGSMSYFVPASTSVLNHV